MKKIVLLLMLMFSIASFSQAGSLDTTFNPTDVGFGYGDGAWGGNIKKSILLPDGKILIFGDFTSYNAQPVSGIARVNPDGTFDASFNSGGTGIGGPLIGGISLTINIAVRQSDGKIIIIGKFSTYNGTPRSCIARINEDGSLDNSFVVGTGFYAFNEDVYGVALQADGKIVLGGNFLTYNAIPQKYITRLNTDGSVDISFNPSGTGLGPNNYGWIYKIAIQPNGQIIILGELTTYSFNYVNKIARLNPDGSVDTTFLAPSTVQIVGPEHKQLVIQPDGKILYCDGVNLDYHSLRRLNANGSVDSGFQPYFYGANDIELLPDGKMYILRQGNSPSYPPLRLNANGSVDTTYITSSNGSNYLYSGEALNMHRLPDDKFILSGEFFGYDTVGYSNISTSTVVRPGLLRINSDRSLDNSFNTGSGVSSPVLGLAVQPDGNILIGGNFYTYNTANNKRRLVRVNSNGSVDPSFQSGSVPNADVNAIKVQTDGKIIIAGYFDNYDLRGIEKVARLNSNGSADASFTSYGNSFSKYFSVAVQPDGKILAGGDVSVYGSYHPSGILRTNINGQFDLMFNTDGASGVSGGRVVYAIELLPDGKIFIGGDFTLFDNVSRNRFARLNSNGTLDTSFEVGTGANGIVYTIVVQPDGKILLGGDFTMYNGTPCGRIVRLNSDGSIDFTFNAVANDDVRTMVLQSTGKILIGGNFTNYNSSGTSYLVRLNTDGSHDYSFNGGNVGPNGQVNIIALQANGQPIIGGEFTAYNGVGRNRIARLQYEVLGVDESTFSNKLTVYPNPARTVINIDSGTTEANIKISDMTGKTFIQQKSASTINVESLASGIYIIEVTTADTKQWQKFIKQ